MEPSVEFASGSTGHENGVLIDLMCAGVGHIGGEEDRAVVQERSITFLNAIQFLQEVGTIRHDTRQIVY